MEVPHGYYGSAELQKVLYFGVVVVIHMPAPSAYDSWLASRRFGIVIDAGSSGSRLQIYSWKDARVVRYEGGTSVVGSLPKVEKGAREGENWVAKVEPGISTFNENPQDIGSYLAPLLTHAQQHVPPSLQPETPLFLLATAGMRLLSQEKQSIILTAACNFFRIHSNFKLEQASSHGPCGTSVRIISGEQEGLFGWIAVNYLMDGFGHASYPFGDRATYGFLDMGGASTQIAFEPGRAERERHKDKLVNVRLNLLGGDQIQHQVFVTTWLGYGTNQARERYVGQAISDFETNRTSPTEDEKELVPDPCLPVGLTLTETPVHAGPSTSHSRKPHTLLGTGSFEQCLKHTAPLLNKTAPCPDAPCLFNGVHVPPIDFSVSHFIGVSEYWYSSEHVFGLGGAYDVVQYERAASEFCARSWEELVREHDAFRAAGHVGGDGEVESGGKVIGTGKWGKEVELSRLEMQCFKAAWIVNVLHEGIGLPRIVDPGGNRTTRANGVGEKAHQKGLGKPTFQSIDAIDDTAISWTLGKMVLEASKEVPVASAATPPLHDPLDPSSASDDDNLNPLKSLRPPFLDFDKFEAQISHRLPSSLTRHSLGVSPFAILFYLAVIIVVLCLTYRLRHRVRTTIRRLRRGSFKREKSQLVFDAYGLEEGRISNGFSRPPTPFSSTPPSPTGNAPSTQRVLFGVSLSLRRILSSARPQVHPSLGSAAWKLPPTRQLRASPARSSRAPASTSTALQPNGNGPFSSPVSRSGSSTPSGVVDEPHLLGHNGPPPGLGDCMVPTMSHPLGTSAQSRSQNSSQMNLTTLVPRTVPYSRSTSIQHIPTFSTHEP